MPVYGPGKMGFIGIHHKCASHHQSRLRWSLEDDGDNIILDEYSKPQLEDKLKKEGWVKVMTPGQFTYEFAVSGLSIGPSQTTYPVSGVEELNNE
jgi:hypothetical protein